MCVPSREAKENISLDRPNDELSAPLSPFTFVSLLIIEPRVIHRELTEIRGRYSRDTIGVCFIR